VCDAEKRVFPKGIPITSITNIHFAPLPRSVGSTACPLFNRAKLPSLKASCQTLCSYQSLNRRPQVDALGYQSDGSCRRAIVRSTHRIPSRSWRLFVAVCPPLRLRLALSFAICFSHRETHANRNLGRNLLNESIVQVCVVNMDIFERVNCYNLNGGLSGQ
jgi:hypothetical protein